MLKKYLQARSLTIPALALMLGVMAMPLMAAKPADFDAKVKNFGQRMAKEHGISQQEIDKLTANVEYQQSIIDAMNRPAEGMPWYKYRPIFLTDQRAEGGVAFWNDNQALLDRAYEKYGVPPEMITAIIGVETRYGGFTGRNRVIDALSTLAFAYPKRGAFFEKELEQFLLLSREQDVDILKAKGSYAGAIGMPQFIPSSYRAYAIDFDNDGRIDLWDSKADIIGSVANYFSRHGWKEGKDITFPVTGTVDVSQFAPLKLKPKYKAGALRRAGFVIPGQVDDEEVVSLIELENEDGNEYWVGLKNFYVITRYNHSNLYAMAAYQLSQDIKDRYQQADRQIVN